MSILADFGAKFNVSVHWENEEPYVKAVDVGKLLGIQNIWQTISNFSEEYKTSLTIRGGTQEATFLTELGLYKVLFISRKPIAETFQDWLANVIKTIRKTGKYELELMKENMKNEEKSFKERIDMALKHESHKIKLIEYRVKHDTLLDRYRDRPVVYFAYVTLPYAEKFNIKIGSTTDLESLTNERHDENFYLFNVVETVLNERFEHFLHQHPKIKPFKNRDFPSETFTVDMKTCKTFVEIAKRNLEKFYETSAFSTSSVTATASAHLAAQSLIIEELKSSIVKIENKIENENKTIRTEKELAEKVTKPVKYAIDIKEDARRVTVNRGNKIQIYDPATQKLVHTFNCLMSCTRDNEFFHSCSKPMIKRSLETHQVYKGYVWMDLDRDKADDFVQPFPTDTVHHTKTIKIGYLAMLSLDKTKIVNVYPDHKSAALDRNLKSNAAISKALTKGTQSRGHYFQMWDDCDPELKREYLENHQLPEKAKRVNGIVIQQVMPATHEVVKTFVCVEDVLRDFQMSRDTLNKAIDGGYVWKGYRWLKLRT